MTVAALIAMAAFASGTPASAASPGSGAITGVVTNTSGSPLSGICVSALPLASGTKVPNVPRTTLTTANGTYTVSNVTVGSYVVYFSETSCDAAPGNPQYDYVAQYYDGRTGGSATEHHSVPVFVKARELVHPIDAVLTLSNALALRISLVSGTLAKGKAATLTFAGTGFVADTTLTSTSSYCAVTILSVKDTAMKARVTVKSKVTYNSCSFAVRNPHGTAANGGLVDLSVQIT